MRYPPELPRGLLPLAIPKEEPIGGGIILVGRKGTTFEQVCKQLVRLAVGKPSCHFLRDAFELIGEMRRIARKLGVQELNQVDGLRNQTVNVSVLNDLYRIRRGGFERRDMR
jgi:hypothetical protein